MTAADRTHWRCCWYQAAAKMRLNRHQRHNEVISCRHRLCPASSSLAQIKRADLIVPKNKKTPTTLSIVLKDGVEEKRSHEQRYRRVRSVPSYRRDALMDNHRCDSTTSGWTPSPSELHTVIIQSNCPFVEKIRPSAWSHTENGSMWKIASRRNDRSGPSVELQ